MSGEIIQTSLLEIIFKKTSINVVICLNNQEVYCKQYVRMGCVSEVQCLLGVVHREVKSSYQNNILT